MTDEIIHSELQEDFQAMRTENTEEIETETRAEEPKPGELESIGTEIGLEEVDLDPETLNTVMVDDTDDNFDIDDDGIEEDIDNEEIISTRSPELTKSKQAPSSYGGVTWTQSYGTGLEGQPTDRAGNYSRRQQFDEDDAILTGGDIDANYEQAAVVGDEAVGGTANTPDQDIVDDLGKAVGLEMSDRSSIRTNDILERRDDNRWELDPQSSDDYKERQND